MNQRKKLNLHSRNLFFSGIVVSRLSYISIPVISCIVFFLSSILYLGGYVTWLLSVNYTRLAELDIAAPWKKQYQQQNQHLPQYIAASIIGIIASFTLIISFWLPITFGLISSWLFFSSNSCWWWAEQINITNSRQRNLSENLLSQRETYFSYVTYAVLNSLLFTINITLYWILPATLILPIGVMLSLFLAALTIHTFHYWLKNIVLTLSLAEEEQEPDPIDQSQTYLKLLQRQDFKLNNNFQQTNLHQIANHQIHEIKAEYTAAPHDAEFIRSNTP